MLSELGGDGMRRRVLSELGQEEEWMKSVSIIEDTYSIIVDTGDANAKSILLFRKDSVLNSIESLMIIDDAPYIGSIYNIGANNGLYGTRDSNGTFQVTDGVFEITTTVKPFKTGKYYYITW